MDYAPGSPLGAAAHERFFIECDTHGRILWMNDRARARLGRLESLLEALPPSDLSALFKLLDPEPIAPWPAMASSLQAPLESGGIPVQLVRLIGFGGRVIISAEVRMRAADTLPAQDNLFRTLLGLQSKVVQNYFRLREAQRKLDIQLGRKPRSLGVVLSEALEMERTRIARELHSGTGQTLAGIKMNLELIESQLSNPPAVVTSGLRRLHALADEAVAEIRSVSQRLYPPDWKKLTLRQALESLWNTTGIPENFRSQLDIRLSDSYLPDAIRFTAYRAVQEGLSNVLRHSSATEVKLLVQEQIGQIHIALVDNGTGFDEQDVFRGASNSLTRGIGLRALREELFALNGQFNIISGPGGTRMEITLPTTENE